MKKILCVLIALCCAFSIVSCNNNGGGTSNPGDGGNTEIGNPLEDVVAASQPTKIVTQLAYMFSGVHDLAGQDLNGMYSLEIDGADSKFTYDYKRLATPEDGASDYIVPVSGAIYFKDGKILLAEGNEWESISAETINQKFNLNKNLFKTYEKSTDEKTLTATLTSSNAEYVLGYSVSAAGDVTVVVTTDGVFMRGITISYVSTQGANVTINTSYSYNDITIEFPAE